MSANLNKTSSSNLFSNPVSVNQLVDLDLDLSCLPSIDLTCGALTPVLQAIIDKICAQPNFDLDCLVASQTYDSVIQAIITKVCALEVPHIPDPLDLSSVNLALGDVWDCDATIPIVATGVTNEEIIQALVSRVIDLSTILKDKCTEIDDLDTRLTQLELTVSNINCCE